MHVFMQDGQVCSRRWDDDAKEEDDDDDDDGDDDGDDDNDDDDDGNDDAKKDDDESEMNCLISQSAAEHWILKIPSAASRNKKFKSLK